MGMNGELAALGAEVGRRLQARGETVAVAESSAAGVIAAALLALSGASAFFRGGAVVYTREAKAALLRVPDARLLEPRPATEGHALVLARGIRDVLGATWGVGETGRRGRAATATATHLATPVSPWSVRARRWRPCGPVMPSARPTWKPSLSPPCGYSTRASPEPTDWQQDG